MCPERASRGAHWCRSSQVDWGLRARGGARNSPSPAERHPPASPWVPVCLRAAKSSFGSPQVPLIVFLRYWAWFDLPNLAGIFSNRAVAGELSGASHIENGFPRPCGLVGVEFADPLVRLKVRLEVCQV